MIHKRTSIALASAALLALLAPACSSDSKSSTTVGGAPAVSSATADTTAAGDTTAPSDTAEAGGATGLGIAGFQYSGGPFTAGTPITVTNSDGAGHTVTDDGGTFDVAVPGNGTTTLTVPAAGTYSIHCKIHGAMKGTITVV